MVLTHIYPHITESTGFLGDTSGFSLENRESCYSANHYKNAKGLREDLNRNRDGTYILLFC